MYKAKEEKILSNNEIKKKRLQDQGITLIALVITIIILLILAGVTLNAAIGENGLFQRAKLATETYEEAESNETASLAEFEKEIKNAYIDYNDYVGYEVIGYKPTEKAEGHEFKITKETSGISENEEKDSNSVKIEKDEKGDQKLKAEDLGGWKIWDYNDVTGVVRLISAKPTEAKLTLKGAEGYNNGVWAVNEVCRELYSNEQSGVSVSNLKRSDIQKVTTYDYTTYNHDSANGGEPRTISLWKCKKI